MMETPMDVQTLTLFLVGGVLLVAGAELLVRGASGVAGAVGISPLVVGLTVVALGTSAPEIAVSAQAALVGKADLAVGNVVGSNLLNVLLILGLSAAIIPLTVAPQLLRQDVPLMIACSLWMVGVCRDGLVDRFEGGLFVAALAGYMTLLCWQGPTAPADARPVEPAGEAAAVVAKPRRVWVDLLLVPVGLGLLVLGAHWLVEGAVAFATWLGVSELIIGLTVVAVGTSLPELATSAVAAVKGERDIAVGNVVGSNIFNILGVLGISAAIAPDGVAVSQNALAFDIPVMTAVMVACLPIFYIGRRVGRGIGLLFLGYYAAYTAYLILASTNHDALPMLSWTMIAFVVPLTVLGVAVGVIRRVRRDLEDLRNPRVGEPGGGGRS
jgi:cation:H+ antiporter